MNKREFLKTSGAFLTSILSSGFASGESSKIVVKYAEASA